jgi:hypothetical protein
MTWRRHLIALMAPVIALTAGLANAAPAAAALPDCMGSSGPNTRLVNAGYLLLHDCAFHGIHTAADGGTISNTGNLALTNVTITDSQATGGHSGGAIWNNNGGALTLNNVTITSSVATAEGGALYNGATTVINGATFGGPNPSDGNQAASGGGFANEGGVTGHDVNIVNNKAIGAGGGGEGGGIFTGDTVTISRLLLKGNTAVLDGGGLTAYGPVTIDHSVIDGNHSDGSGGGVFNSGQTFAMSTSTVKNNTSGADGAGLINAAGGEVDLSDDTIDDNHATGNGGGIALSGGLLIGPKVASASSSARGHGQPRQPTDSLGLAPNLTISNNRADINGGGLYAACPNGNASEAGLLNPTIAGNSAALGGAIWVSAAGGNCNSASLVELEHALVANNTPTNCVGAVTEVGAANSANLETGHSCKFNQANDQNDVADPHLGPLADNFGPAPTQALRFGSSAIDAVPGGCPPPGADERGTTRPQAANCDIGAYECIGVAPTVTQVAPATGDHSGGTPVTITGTNFDRPANVNFGSSPATNVVVNSSTQITATSPPGTGKVDVTVQTCRASGVDAFTFTTPPTLPEAGSPAQPTTQRWAVLVLALLLGGPSLAILALGRRSARRHP